MTGIGDGLTWAYLSGVFGVSRVRDILECAWWWRHAWIHPSLSDYLSRQHDEGRAVCAAYEAISRLQRGYPLGVPFNQLTGHQAENFASEYQVRPDPRHGKAVIRDSIEQEISRRSPQGSELIDRSNRDLLNFLSEAYSEPIVFRFNLHHPPGNAAKAVKAIVSELQNANGGLTTRKNRRSFSLSHVEAWDVRRWLEDDRSLVLRNQTTFGHPRSPTDVTKARVLAEETQKRFKQIPEENKQYVEISGGRTPVHYPPLLLSPRFVPS